MNEATSETRPIHEALRNFAAAVAGKRAQLAAGAPEEQLRISRVWHRFRPGVIAIRPPTPGTPGC